MKRWVALALVSFIPALAFGQSLAEVAKKERERREKNKQKGVEARTVEENELNRPQPAPPRPPAAKTESVPGSNQDPRAVGQGCPRRLGLSGRSGQSEERPGDRAAKLGAAGRSHGFV